MLLGSATFRVPLLMHLEIRNLLLQKQDCCLTCAYDCMNMKQQLLTMMHCRAGTAPLPLAWCSASPPQCQLYTYAACQSAPAVIREGASSR